MKIRFGKKENEFYARICRGNGGVSSCVCARHGSLMFVLGLFKIRNILKAL